MGGGVIRTHRERRFEQRPGPVQLTLGRIEDGEVVVRLRQLGEFFGEAFEDLARSGAILELRQDGMVLWLLVLFIG